MTRLGALAGGLAAALALAGCAQQRAGGLAPISFGPGEQAASAAGVVTVAAGDTLYEIARRYDVPARGLIEENGLEPPYALRIGQRLLLPKARFHTVRKGDTLYAISRMYQVDMAELARANRLQVPYNIRIGESLRLPAATGDEPAPVTAVAQAPAAAPVTPVEPSRTTVAPPAPVAAVQPAPAPAPSSVPGQSQATVPLPGTKPSAGAPPAVQAPPAQVAAVPVPAPPPAPEASPAPAAAAPAAKPPTPSSPPAAEEAPPRSSGRFAWPARGQVLSEYGPKSGGLHNDGINIAAPKGSPVFSAENGVVAYAGNELRGFGNLLLIRHADGWMTAYAHLDGMQVARGDKVTRGQKIGTVGSTGSVAEPQLHFEVRKGSRAVDPREFLDGKKTVSRDASRDGQPGPG